MRWMSSWRRSGATTAGTGPDAPAVPAADVVACGAPPGRPVPPGFVGLRVSPGLVESRPVPSGSVLAASKADPPGTRLWWLREAPWVIRFAPQPAAPLAGLEVHLGPALGTGEAGVKLLRWLQAQVDREEMHHADLIAQWRDEPILCTLPPCITPGQLEARQAALSQTVLMRMGCEVHALRRVDLEPDEAGWDLPEPDPVETASQPAAETAPYTGAVPRRRPVTPVAPPSSSGAAAPDSTATSTQGDAGPAWPRLQADDVLACARLSDEIPQLSAALREAWSPAAAWSDCRAVILRQRDIQNLLQLLASTVHQMPSLAGGGPDPTRTTLAHRCQIAAESRHAEQALAECWHAVRQLRPSEVPEAGPLDDLERAIGRLAVAVRRRQDAWWLVGNDPHTGTPLTAA